MPVLSDTHDERAIRRRHLLFNLRVSEPDGRHLGWVGNITTDGLLLLCRAAIPAGTRLDLIVEAPGVIGDDSSLSCQATSRYCRTDMNDAYFDVGLAFMGLRESQRQLLRTWIMQYAID